MWAEKGKLRGGGVGGESEKKRKKWSFFSPEIPESWLSKHSPGYFESQFCKNEQMR